MAVHVVLTVAVRVGVTLHRLLQTILRLASLKMSSRIGCCVRGWNVDGMPVIELRLSEMGWRLLSTLTLVSGDFVLQCPPPPVQMLHFALPG